MSDEMTVEEAKHVHWATNKACRDCIHGFGKIKFDNTPMKDACAKYPEPRGKPKEIAFDGAPCEFHEKHPNPPKYVIIGKTPIVKGPDGMSHFDIEATPDEEYCGLNSK